MASTGEVYDAKPDHRYADWDGARRRRDRTVPTARFAQPIGTLVVNPMLGLSGLFIPIESLPPTLQAVARVLPLTYAVSLLRGIWHGEGWSSHVGDISVLSLMFVAFTMASAKVFRWE